ncbi:hypothetical protein P280DRAFT_518554 [Massarina eburnea CBS 473.64]|uniref:Uncharacterized protein n=1 Tax=Massarina eburnea CBS 473.64 TaxID=1395130 RepID=A0A6A6RXQ3_9PLEO|nr:hypothetical protein P280DRAFT_518554 [Massarina eburnea CBS 473.64]
MLPESVGGPIREYADSEESNDNVHPFAGLFDAFTRIVPLDEGDVSECIESGTTQSFDEGYEIMCSAGLESMGASVKVDAVEFNLPPSTLCIDYILRNQDYQKRM